LELLISKGRFSEDSYKKENVQQSSKSKYLDLIKVGEKENLILLLWG